VATRTATTHTFYIGVGDTLPIIEEQILQSTGEPLDLTNATSVKFTMVQVDSRIIIPKITLAAAVITPGDLTQGWVEYHWTAGNTDTEGEFFRKWTVNFNAAVVTMPNYLDRGYPVQIT
jgi:hypothetical protein